jgi:hypothetical protein
MPRKKSKKPSLRSYFKTHFDAHPEWLELKDNSGPLGQWQTDHPGQPVTAKIKANLASLKSKMRADLRGGSLRKAAPKTAAAVSVAPSAAVEGLEALEQMIDGCLAVARGMGVDRLGPVIKHLRIALAHIVLMFDEKR